MPADKPSWQEQKKNYEQRQSLYWEDMEAGRKFEPFVFPITEELVNDLMEVTGDRNPLYCDEEVAKKSPYGGKISHQGMAMIYGRLSYLGENYRPAPGGMVTGLSFQFVQPAKVGDVITSTAMAVNKEEKKGRKYFTLRAESFNQKGELVSVMEQTGILPK